MCEGRTPPSGGSAVTTSCLHDFVFREQVPFYGKVPDDPATVARDRWGLKDIFYCRHCLEYREVPRK